jgi:short-subunit dehydrogenase
MRGFALSMREDLRAASVGVSTVYPGFIRDAGMFAKSGVELPRGVGTRTPENVAAGVVRGIERNLAEVNIAPLGVRLGAAFAGVAPELSAHASRRMGAGKIAAGLADAQRENR